MRLAKFLGGVSLFAALAGCAQTRLSKDTAYVVADQPARPASGVRVTYLGTAGYLLESRDATVLIDPYFTRPSFSRVLTNAPVEPDLVQYEWAFAHLPPRAARPDLILVTHGHVDHAFDAVEIARKSRAKFVASPSTCYIAQAAGLDAGRTRPMPPGKTEQFGAVKLTAIHSPHPEILGGVPFTGIETSRPARAPRKMSDWKVGEPLSFLIEMGGRRIFHGSGAAAIGLPPQSARVDLAIVGVATKEDAKALTASLRQLKPHHFLPTHQDNFFNPLDQGFTYLPTADFDAARKAWADAGKPGRLILLDYFHPWTLR